MKRKITRSSNSNVRKKQQKNDKFQESTSFLLDLLQSNVSLTENNVRKALDQKNIDINKLKSELKECKTTLKCRDDQIKVLDNEKEVFNQIMFSEVQKFDGSYQNRIDKLEAEKEEMKNQVLNYESKVKYYEKQLEENKSVMQDTSILPIKDEEKARKLVKKCKELKVKVKSRDFEIFQKEMEKREMKKLIDAKDEKIQKNAKEIFNMDQKLKDEYEKYFSLEILYKSKKNLEEELEKKDKEIEKMKLRFTNKEETIALMKEQSDALHDKCITLQFDLATNNKLIKAKDVEIRDNNRKLLEEKSETDSLKTVNKINVDLEKKLEEKDFELGNIKLQMVKDKETIQISMSTLKQGFDTLKTKNGDLEEEMKIKDRELGELKQKSVADNEAIQMSMDKLKEGFEKGLAEKDEEMKSMTEHNNLMYRELLGNAAAQNDIKYKDLLRRQQETSKRLLENKNNEIMKLTKVQEQAEKKGNILMEIIKSKDLMIRKLEGNGEVMPSHESENYINSQKDENDVVETPQNESDNMLSKETKHLESSLFKRGINVIPL